MKKMGTVPSAQPNSSHCAEHFLGARNSPHFFQDSGFCLAEFLVSSVILLIIASAVFGMLAETQRAASYESETHAVLQNTRMGMSSLERYIRHAANDPRNSAFAGVTVVSQTEIRLRADITGSAGPGSPDKGDPDGDTSDSGEDVTIRYNSTTRSIEVIPSGGSAQAVANNISAFSMTCYDAAGAITTNGANVRRIQVSLTGTSPAPHPQTRQTFSNQFTSDIQLSARN